MLVWHLIHTDLLVFKRFFFTPYPPFIPLGVFLVFLFYLAFGFFCSSSTSSLLITCDHSSNFWKKHPFTAPQLDKDNSKDDALIAGMEGRGRSRSACAHLVCQVKLFLHFILLAPYLFNCLSASLLGYVWAPGLRLCVCLRAATAKVRRQAACCVKGCGGMFKPQSAGIVCEIQMLEMAPLFAYCYHCSLAQKRRVLGFDLTREKQNDKLSHQLSSNPPPPLLLTSSILMPHPAVDGMKKTTYYKVIHRQLHSEQKR